MKLFSTDLRIFATAYVWANNQKEAVDKFRAIANGNTGLEFSSRPEEIGEGIQIDGRPFSLMSVNDIVLSPCMTIDKQLIPITMIEEVKLEPEPANDVN